jgi:outer membrane protein TolC
MGRISKKFSQLTVRTNKRCFFLAGLLVLLGGCASAAPVSEIAEAYLPLAVQRSGGERTPLPSAPLTLDEVVKMALAHSRKIEMAERDVAIQDDRLLGALSNFLPKVQVSSDYHLRDNLQGTKVSGMPQPLIMGEKDVFTGKAQLVVPLYTFGQNSSLYAQAARIREAAQFAAVRAKDEVVLEATQAYFILLDALSFKEVVDKSLEQIRSHKKVAQEFFDQGIVTKNDVLTAEVRESEMEQQLLIAENNIIIARSNLNRLLGIDLDNLTEVERVAEPAQLQLSLRECITAAFTHRPEISQMRKVKEAAEAGRSAAWASVFPRISAGGAWNYSDDPTQLHKDYWTVDAMLEWNIFSGLANTARIGEAKKQVQQVKTREKELLDAVALQVRTAYFNAKQAIAQIEVARKARASATENLRMFEEQYRENLASSTDVLDAEAQLARAESNLIGALYRSNVAAAELETAIGQKLEKIRSGESAVGREAGNPPAKQQSTQEGKKSETEK